MFVRKKDFRALLERVEALEKKVALYDKEMLVSVEKTVKEELEKTDSIRAIDVLDEYLNGAKK